MTKRFPKVLSERIWLIFCAMNQIDFSIEMQLLLFVLSLYFLFVLLQVLIVLIKIFRTKNNNHLFHLYVLASCVDANLLTSNTDNIDTDRKRDNL